MEHSHQLRSSDNSLIKVGGMKEEIISIHSGTLLTPWLSQQWVPQVVVDHSSLLDSKDISILWRLQHLMVAAARFVSMRPRETLFV